MTRPATHVFHGKRVLITGGTGSLGKTLVRRLLDDTQFGPDRIVVLSRDEAKQHQMRLDFERLRASTDEVVFDNFRRRLQFRIGDVRDFDAVSLALRDIDIVINAAAMKQVPTCEYFPFEAINTNVTGAHNIVTAIHRHRLAVEAVVGISTDKAVMPVNVMGMSKALQERLYIAAQVALPEVRMLVVRYGNVMASRGSVIPLFQQQIRAGIDGQLVQPPLKGLSIEVARTDRQVLVKWSVDWRDGPPPRLELRLPGFEPVVASPIRRRGTNREPSTSDQRPTPIRRAAAST